MHLYRFRIKEENNKVTTQILIFISFYVFSFKMYDRNPHVMETCLGLKVMHVSLMSTLISVDRYKICTHV